MSKRRRRSIPLNVFQLLAATALDVLPGQLAMEGLRPHRSRNARSRPRDGWSWCGPYASRGPRGLGTTSRVTSKRHIIQFKVTSGSKSIFCWAAGRPRIRGTCGGVCVVRVFQALARRCSSSRR